MNKDAHAWKYEQAPDPRLQKPFQIRAKVIAEVKEVLRRRIGLCAEYNSTGGEEAKGHLRAALGEIERLA